MWVKRLEEQIGISFRNKDLLRQSLTHRSYSHACGTKDDNERLEFLGDSVLNLIVSDYLYERYPDVDEGKLTKIKSNLVNKKALVIWSKRVGLQDFILMSKEEEASDGRNKDSILSDALESLIGAIYKDRGFVTAEHFVLREISMKEDLDRADYKSLLQELVQKRHRILPSYYVKAVSGPEHKKVFEVEVKVEERVAGKGIGRNKKEAEQQAAMEALKKLKAENI